MNICISNSISNNLAAINKPDLNKKFNYYLPNELFKEIFSFLGCKELLQCSLCCYRFRDFALEPINEDIKILSSLIKKKEIQNETLILGPDDQKKIKDYQSQAMQKLKKRSKSSLTVNQALVLALVLRSYLMIGCAALPETVSAANLKNVKNHEISQKLLPVIHKIRTLVAQSKKYEYRSTTPNFADDFNDFYTNLLHFLSDLELKILTNCIIRLKLYKNVKKQYFYSEIKKLSLKEVEKSKNPTKISVKVEKLRKAEFLCSLIQDQRMKPSVIKAITEAKKNLKINTLEEGQTSTEAEKPEIIFSEIQLICQNDAIKKNGTQFIKEAETLLKKLECLERASGSRKKNSKNALHLDKALRIVSITLMQVSLHNIIKALEYAEKIKMPSTKNSVYREISTIYLKNNDIDSALSIVKKISDERMRDSVCGEHAMFIATSFYNTKKQLKSSIHVNIKEEEMVEIKKAIKFIELISDNSRLNGYFKKVINLGFTADFKQKIEQSNLLMTTFKLNDRLFPVFKGLRKKFLENKGKELANFLINDIFDSSSSTINEWINYFSSKNNEEEKKEFMESLVVPFLSILQELKLPISDLNDSDFFANTKILHRICSTKAKEYFLSKAMKDLDNYINRLNDGGFHELVGELLDLIDGPQSSEPQKKKTKLI